MLEPGCRVVVGDDTHKDAHVAVAIDHLGARVKIVRDTAQQRAGLIGKSLLAYGGEVSDVYKAISDPTRRAILDGLVEWDRQTLFELCGRLATKYGLTASRQAVSQHLQVLQGAGPVIAAREGRYTFHTTDTGPLRVIADRWPPTQGEQGYR